MPKFFIVFNGKSNEELNINVAKRPSVPSPKRRYRETEVPGRDGMLYEDLGTYENIDIEIEFSFISRVSEEFNSDYRKIKKWLNNVKDNKLKFSDDLGFFYFVEKVEIDTPERIIKRAGKFIVTFICEPWQYLKDGEESIKIESSIDNEYDITYPVYDIIGEGLLILSVNGNETKINVGQRIKIDTKLGICYKADGTFNNIAFRGDYKSLILKEGNNTFSYTNGFEIYITPRWRCL